MRLDRISARGLRAFPELDLDLRALPRGVVAITGANGAGKSTLLELLPAALYRQTPTHGPLAKLARDRDAWLEVDVVNGAPLRVRQVVDAVSGKGETLLTGADGRPVSGAESAKVREADRWIARHAMPPEVLYAALFAVQGSAGFLGLSAGERKAVLLRALGLDRLERIAEAAREAAREAKSAMERVAAKIEELGEVDLAAVDQRVEAAYARLVVAEQAEDARRGELESTRARLDAEKEATARWREAVAARVRADRALAEERARLEDAVRRIENNAALLARAEQTRAAAARAVEIRTELDALTSALAVHRGQLERHEATRGAALRAIGAAGRALAELRLQRATLEKRIAGLEGARAASLEWQRAHADVASLDEHIAAARRDIERVTSEREVGDGERIARLRGGLTAIAEGVEVGEMGAHDAETHAKKTLIQDDHVSIRASARVTLLADLRGQVDALVGKRAAVAADCERAAEAMRPLASETAWRADLERVQAEIERVSAEEDAATVTAFEAADQAKATKLRIDVVRVRANELSEELSRLGDTEKDLARLDAAEPRIREMEEIATKALARLVELEDERAAIPDAPRPVVPVAELEKAVAAADSRHRAAHSEVTSATSEARAAQDAHERATRDAARRAELEAELASAAERLADRVRIAQDVGRDGLQALEIDAAGPELTQLINELLHESFGTRWTARVSTTRVGSTGRALEDLTITVIDTETGREADALEYSGGERVILGEAISLALSVVACRRAGLEHGVTLFRDESGAALDAARKPAYLAMLRRAAAIIGAHHVLLVTHDEQTASACDSRLHVADGRVEVVS